MKTFMGTSTTFDDIGSLSSIINTTLKGLKIMSEKLNAGTVALAALGGALGGIAAIAAADAINDYQANKAAKKEETFNAEVESITEDDVEALADHISNDA